MLELNRKTSVLITKDQRTLDEDVADWFQGSPDGEALFHFGQMVLVESHIIHMLDVIKIQVPLERLKDLLFRSFKFILESFDLHFVSFFYELLSLKIGHVLFLSYKLLFVFFFGLKVAIVHEEVNLFASLNESI